MKLLTILLLLFFEISCDSGQNGAHDDSRRNNSDSATKSCTAKFTVLQKDAYREDGGREYPYYPVHTSTALEIKCPHKTLQLKKSNHGAEPGEKDSNGRDLLDVTNKDTMTLSKERAEKLARLYDSLSCDNTNTFLSIDKASEEVQEFFYSEEFKDKMKENLERNLIDAGKESAAELLSDSFSADRDYRNALEKTYNNLNNPSLWVKIFTKAWSQSSSEFLGEQLTKYHVCNNDASVSWKIWQEFKAGSKEVSRNAEWFKNLCSKGPLLFFDPKS